MQIVRFLIVFFSWAILVPTPSSSVDFFRTLVIFTMSMTYDWWNEVIRAKDKGQKIHKWFYNISIGYSVIWLVLSFSGMSSLAILSGNHLANIRIFPDTEMEFGFSRIIMVILMLGYPIISIIEKMIPAQGNEEPKAAEEVTV